MNDEDKVAEEMTSLVLKVWQYAHANSIDITSHDDVTKILDTIKPEKVGEVNIDTLIEGLVAFDRMTKTELSKRQKPN